MKEENKKKIISKFNELIKIYQDNLNDINISENFVHEIQIRSVGKPELILLLGQSKVFWSLISMIQENIPLPLSIEFIKKNLLECIYSSFKRLDNINQICEKMISKFENTKLKSFTLIRPALVYIDQNREIMGVKLIINPAEYIREKYPNSIPVIHGNLEENFMPLSSYNPHLEPISIASLVDIKAIDLQDAEYQFKFLTQAVTGFFNLVSPGYNISFNPNLFRQDSLYYIEEQGLGWEGRNRDEINVVHFTEDFFKYELIDKSLTWLNAPDLHKDKVKSNKIKQALYWYSYVVAEKNITIKFIYLIIILELILKKDSEESGIAQILADRLACNFYINKDSKENVRKLIKKIYDKRSKIVHTGAVLGIKDEILFSNTEYFVQEILKYSLDQLSNPDISFNLFINNLKMLEHI